VNFEGISGCGNLGAWSYFGDFTPSFFGRKQPAGPPPMTRQSNMQAPLRIASPDASLRSPTTTLQLTFRARALALLEEEPFDAAALRCAVALVAAARRAGSSASKLRFNTSIKLMTFSADGLATTTFVGTSACFFLSFSIKTVR
jgi:hypothetical protein